MTCASKHSSSAIKQGAAYLFRGTDGFQLAIHHPPSWGFARDRDGSQAPASPARNSVMADLGAVRFTGVGGLRVLSTGQKN